MFSEFTISSNKENILYKRIEEIQGKKLPILLFGASLRKDAIELFEKFNIDIYGFIDNDKEKQGKKLFGLNIFGFKEVLDRYNQNEVVIVIVANAGAQEIEQQINNAGWTQNIQKIDLSCIEVEDWNNYYNENIEKLKKVYNFLEDEYSKKIFSNIVNYRILNDRNLIKEICDIEENQYFDKEIIKIENDETFLDLGAFDGDTVENFIKRNNTYKKIISFEPNRDNYKKLYNKYNSNERVQMFNIGTFDKTTQLGFSSIGGKQAQVEEYGEETINVVDVDSFLCKENITFIKMDIEGSEKETIKGAETIIKKLKPKLAICIYHKKEDLFEIPLMIKELVPEYKIYIRHYSEAACDTVCYAILEK